VCEVPDWEWGGWGVDHSSSNRTSKSRHPSQPWHRAYRPYPPVVTKRERGNGHNERHEI